MQALEIGDPIRTEHHGLAVDDKRGFPEPERGFGDQRVSVGPIVAPPRQQPHALTLALHNQAVSVVFDFVKPIRAGWNFGAALGDTRLVLKATQHAGLIASTPPKMRVPRPILGWTDQAQCESLEW